MRIKNRQRNCYWLKLIVLWRRSSVLILISFTVRRLMCVIKECLVKESRRGEVNRKVGKEGRGKVGRGMLLYSIFIFIIYFVNYILYSIFRMLNYWIMWNENNMKNQCRKVNHLLTTETMVTTSIANGSRLNIMNTVPADSPNCPNLIKLPLLIHIRSP